MTVRTTRGQAPLRQAPDSSGPGAPAMRPPAERRLSSELGLLNHDLRAALADIIGGIDLIALEDLGPDARRQIDRVRAAGGALAGLTDEALSLLSGEAPELRRPATAMPLATILSGLEARWSGHADASGCAIAVTVAPGVAMLSMPDGMAVERILSNLIANAIRHGGKGVVTLAAVATSDGAVSFTVTDEGPGFPAAVLAHLSNGSATSALGLKRPDNSGNGLGLVIASSLARVLNGRLTAHNLPNGAQVCVQLPPRRQAIAPVGLAASLTGLRVLLAEDNATSCLVATRMLEQLGAICTTATTGTEALALLGSRHFDLALIDVELPEVSGLAVIGAVRAQETADGRLPVIALTGHTLATERDTLRGAGADAVIAKPLGTAADLAEAIIAVCPGACRPSGGPETAVVPDVAARLDRFIAIAGPDHSAAVLTQLVCDFRTIRRELVAGVANGDSEQVRRSGHVLIALSASVGADTLHRLAHRLTSAARLGDLPSIRQNRDGALSRIDALITRIEQRRDDGATPA